MKNLKNAITAVTLVLTMFIGINVDAQELSELSKDKTFVSYVKDQLEFNKNNNIELVNELASQEEIVEGQLDLFYEAFNINEEKYAKFLKTQQGRLKALNEIYKLESLSAEELSPYFGDTLTQLGVGQGQNQTMSGPCMERFVANLAMYAAAAYIGHTACLPAHATLVGGVLCHAAVATIQIAANHIAGLDYQDCINN